MDHHFWFVIHSKTDHWAQIFDAFHLKILSLNIVSSYFWYISKCFGSYFLKLPVMFDKKLLKYFLRFRFLEFLSFLLLFSSRRHQHYWKFREMFSKFFFLQTNNLNLLSHLKRIPSIASNYFLQNEVFEHVHTQLTAMNWPSQMMWQRI